MESDEKPKNVLEGSRNVLDESRHIPAVFQN